LLAAKTDPFVTTVLNQYLLSNYKDSAPIALGAAGTDRVFACPALSGDLSLAQWVPTYAYEFNDEHAPSFFDRPVSFPLGAYHSAEVLYLLDTHLLNAKQPGFQRPGFATGRPSPPPAIRIRPMHRIGRCLMAQPKNCSR